MWEPFTHGKPSEAAALSAAASIGKQQLFFDCVHFWAVSQVLEGAFPNGRASGTTTFPQRQGIGDNDLSPTASSMEPFAGGKSAGNSRSFGECIPRQAVPTASGAAFFLQIFLL